MNGKTTLPIIAAAVVAVMFIVSAVPALTTDDCDSDLSLLSSNDNIKEGLSVQFHYKSFYISYEYEDNVLSVENGMVKYYESGDFRELDYLDLSIFEKASFKETYGFDYTDETTYASLDIKVTVSGNVYTIDGTVNNPNPEDQDPETEVETYVLNDLRITLNEAGNCIAVSGNVDHEETELNKDDHNEAVYSLRSTIEYFHGKDAYYYEESGHEYLLYSDVAVEDFFSEIMDTVDDFYIDFNDLVHVGKGKIEGLVVDEYEFDDGWINGTMYTINGDVVVKYIGYTNGYPSSLIVEVFD